jgi:hypothetical protein
MSALHPKADIDERDWHVRFVPIADVNAEVFTHPPVQDVGFASTEKP